MTDDGGSVMINSQYGLLSRNTIPNQPPWRATWFDCVGPIDHVPLSMDQVEEFWLSGRLLSDFNGKSILIEALGHAE